MYSYVVVDLTNKTIDSGECAFRQLNTVIDFYGEKLFTITVKKVVDQKELRN